MNCRHCDKELENTFIDLGSSPPSNAYLTKESLSLPEKRYPLKVLVCSNCWLVQTDDFVMVDEMFSNDYAYYSSYSSSWLIHSFVLSNLGVCFSAWKRDDVEGSLFVVRRSAAPHFGMVRSFWFRSSALRQFLA